MHHIRGLTRIALVLMIGLISACGTDDEPLELDQSGIRTITIEVKSGDETTPNPTYQPTAIITAPDILDREFNDDEQMQADRLDLVNTWIEPAVSNRDVLAAMNTVPRHSFIPTNYLHRAYGDHPLPIGYGQTISQPSLVAIMTELLELEAGDRVLEIGTGSGYQAAILAQLTDEVYTVEIIPELAATAKAVFETLGYDQIKLDQRDGYFGWREHAPYDAIIVTAAPDHLPSPLVEQLSPEGGRMVIPIGPVGNVQTLWLVTREGEDVQMEQLMDVAFVPFTRDHQED